MNSRIKKFVFVIFSIFLIFVFIFCILGFRNKTYDKIFNNIYIGNINVSNMNKSEVKEQLEYLNNDLSNRVLTIYQGDNEIYKLSLSDFDYLIDSEELFNEVYGFGRTDNVFRNNFFVLKQNFNKKYIELKYVYNENKLREVVKNLDLMIEDRYLDDSYYIDLNSNKLVLKSGRSGNSIDIDNELDNILHAIKNNKDNYVLNVSKKENKKLNFEEVYSDVKKECIDAKIENVNGKRKVINEENGYDIDKNLLKKEIDNLKDISIIDLEVIKPNIKLMDLDNELYNEKIAGFTTYFNSSILARSNNLRIGLEKLNNKVINPGEIFSFNKTIGEISKRTGYMEAPVFKGPSIVNEPGGGICQLSSTMYNALLLSNFEIIERHNHGLPVGYVLPSRDATVYSGVLDLKMKNIRKYPVKIITNFNETGSLNISVYGIKEDEEYDIELVSEVLTTKPFDTKYIYDESLAKDEKIILNRGSEGKTSVLYLIKRLNGNEEKILISKDVYKPHDEVIKIGIKE